MRGSRGTASGWVHVHIAYAPKDRDELEKLKHKVWALFGAAKIEIGTYGYDDPGSDYGYGHTITIGFDQCRDVFNEGETVNTCTGKSGIVYSRDYRTGGDWYLVRLADGTEESFSKNDMTRNVGVAA